LLFLDYYMKELMRRDYDMVIMDQSFVQTLWSVMVHGAPVDPRVMNRLVEGLYSNYVGSVLFVMIDIDAQTAASRARARGLGYSRFDHLELDEAATLITIHAGQLRMAMTQAARVTKGSIEALDGLQSAKDNAVQLADFAQQQAASLTGLANECAPFNRC
jgi:hypothetical protein